MRGGREGGTFGSVAYFYRLLISLREIEEDGFGMLSSYEDGTHCTCSYVSIGTETSSYIIYYARCARKLKSSSETERMHMFIQGPKCDRPQGR